MPPVLGLGGRAWACPWRARAFPESLLWLVPVFLSLKVVVLTVVAVARLRVQSPALT